MTIVSELALRRRRLPSLAVASLLVGTPAAFGQAQQQQPAQQQQSAPTDTGQLIDSWSVEVGAEHTDNVERTSTDEQSETIGTVGLTFDLASDRPRLDSSLMGDLRYHKYFDDTYDNELAGEAAGLATYSFVPERFTWMAQDNFAQIAIQRTAVDTPDNRQNINYFTTGPDLTLPVSSRNSLLFSGRFSDTYYEDSIEDSQSLAGTLGFQHAFSQQTMASLNVSMSKIEYDEEDLFEEYEIRDAFFRIATEGVNTTFTGDFGYSEFERGEEKSDSPLVRITISRTMSARSRLDVELGTEFATSGQMLRLDQTAEGVDSVGSQDVVAASDAFRSEYVYLGWNTAWTRTTLDLGLHARSEDYETDADLDRDIYGGGIGLSRQFTRRLRGDLTGGYEREEFTTTGFSFDEWYAGFGLLWDVTQRVGLRLRFDHFDGSSNDGLRDYDENRVSLFIVYSRGT